MNSGWDVFPTVDEHIAALVRSDATFQQYNPGARPRGEPVVQFYDFINRAGQTAKTAGWNGNLRGAMHVFFAPTAQKPSIGLVWRQDSGDTFVVSEVPLLYLEADEVAVGGRKRPIPQRK